MSFVSSIEDAPIIDDDNFLEFVDPVVDGEQTFRGMNPRDYSKVPLGSVPGLSKLDLELIDPDEYDERIEAKERYKDRLRDVCQLHHVQPKNQGRTNFCWANAPVAAVQILRLRQGLKHVELSAASVAAKFTKFANRHGNPSGIGGWGTDAVAFIREFGIVPEVFWPGNANDPQYDKAEHWTLAKEFIVSEWTDIQPRNLSEIFTLLLLGFPVAAGLNWWGHEVLFLDVVKLPGTKRYGILFLNSWGIGFGDKGYGVLTGDRMRADDAVAPRVVKMSNPKLILPPSVAA